MSTQFGYKPHLRPHEYQIAVIQLLRFVVEWHARPRLSPSTYNFPIQATCADILKTALRFFYLSKQRAFVQKDVTVVLTAHDEIVFQCLSAHSEEVEQQVKTIMLAAAHAVLKEIQCDVEIGVGDSWAAKP